MEVFSILVSLLTLFTMGIFLVKVFEYIKLPKLIGYLITGLIVGTTGVDWVHPWLYDNIKIFTSIALAIILFESGMGIHKDKIKQVGRPVLLLGVVPCLMEGLVIMGISHFILDMPIEVAGLLGFIIAAISPAIVVPAMTKLKKGGYGVAKGIPTLKYASSSIDDIIAILMFTVFLELSLGQGNIGFIIGAIPIKISLGIIIGGLMGFIMKKIFEFVESKSPNLTQYPKFFIPAYVIILAILVLVKFYFDQIYISELFTILMFGYVFGNYVKLPVRSQIATTNGNVWQFAQIFLFTLIGAKVALGDLVGFTVGQGSTEIIAPLNIGWALLIIAVGLSARLLGAWLSVIGTKFNTKERVFILLANFPKATVQAALGSIPMSMIVGTQWAGTVWEIYARSILAIAVLAILITAPLGLILVEYFGPKLLNSDQYGLTAFERIKQEVEWTTMYNMNGFRTASQVRKSIEELQQAEKIHNDLKSKYEKSIKTLKDKQGNLKLWEEKSNYKKEKQEHKKSNSKSSKHKPIK